MDVRLLINYQYCRQFIKLGATSGNIMAARKQIMDKPVNCIVHPDSQHAYKLQYTSKTPSRLPIPIFNIKCSQIDKPMNFIILQIDKSMDFIELQTTNGTSETKKNKTEHKERKGIIVIHASLICCGGCPNL